MGQYMATIKAGFVIFATMATTEGIEDARAFLRTNGFAKDQARLYRHDGQVMVELLRPWNGATPLDPPAAV